ncbi:hypothetical protein, partial [Okeania sp. SIO3B5]|uniref:hypothetical protein n=1 Tax=Okeania sp. SIO3B5 TaxID=2607811 RepID=UPI0025FFBB65
RGARGVGAAANVSDSYAKQNVNPPRSLGSVGIPVPSGRGGCQSIYKIRSAGLAALKSWVIRVCAQKSYGLR